MPQTRAYKSEERIPPKATQLQSKNCWDSCLPTLPSLTALAKPLWSCECKGCHRSSSSINQSIKSNQPHVANATRTSGTGRHKTHGARNHLSGILLTKGAFKLELEQDKASQKSLLNIRALVQNCSCWHPWDSFLGHTHFQPLQRHWH